jgi:hypothetical protein
MGSTIDWRTPAEDVRIMIQGKTGDERHGTTEAKKSTCLGGI